MNDINSGFIVKFNLFVNKEAEAPDSQELSVYEKEYQERYQAREETIKKIRASIQKSFHYELLRANESPNGKIRRQYQQYQQPLTLFDVVMNSGR